MTVARTVADVLTEHVTLRGGVHRPDVSERVPAASCSTPPGWSATCTGSSDLPIASTAPLAQDHRPVHPRRCTGSPRPRAFRGSTSPRVQRKDDVMQERLQALHRAGGGGVHRSGAGEDHRVPHREAAPPGRGRVSVDREDHRGDQPVLLLLRGRRFRAVLPQVLFLFPVHRRSSASTVITGRSGKRRRPGSGSPRWTTRSPPSTTRPGCRLICDRLGPAQIQALLDKWLAILPNPFTEADTDAGYRYQLSILQAEFSLTQMLDNPVSGRVFFEQVIRDNLDIGRPDQVSLIFDRRPEAARSPADAGPVPDPGDHRGRHPEPARRLQERPRSSSTTRKDRALRTETTINDTRDFEIGKRLTNLPALREIGFPANRRLLRVQRLEPRPDHRHRCPAHRHRPRHHRQRHPRPGAAAGPTMGQPEFGSQTREHPPSTPRDQVLPPVSRISG